MGSPSDVYGRPRVILVGLPTFTLFTWPIALAANFYIASIFRLVSGFGEGIF